MTTPARPENQTITPRVGGTVWVFDINRRVYTQPKVGWGKIIWKEYWRPTTIVSETSRSWVLKGDEKIPKRGWSPRLVAFSQAEIDERAYVEENRHQISERVRRVENPAVLRAIEALLERAV